MRTIERIGINGRGFDGCDIRECDVGRLAFEVLILRRIDGFLRALEASDSSAVLSRDDSDISNKGEEWNFESSSTQRDSH